MNKLLIWLLLLPGVAFSQKYGSYEPNQVARDTLELVDGINGSFIVSDTTILPLQIFYAQFSDDGINFHRKYAEGRDIWRISTDSQYNWDTIDFRGLTTSIDSIIENGYWVVMVDTSDTIRNTNKLTALGDGMDVTLSDKELRFAVTIPQTSELGYYFSRNVGTGVGTYDSTDNTTFNYRSISGDNYITVTLVGTDIVLTFDPTQLVIEDGVAMISDGFDSTGYAESNFDIPSLSPLSFSISEQFFAGYANATHNKLMLYRDDTECCYDYWLLKVCTPNEEVTQDTSYVIQLGYLYNWYAASDSRNMAPVGWRVPTYSDIVDLRYALDPSGSGGSNIAGGLMKEQGTLYWDSPNSLATNISGFNAKGAGYRSHLLGDYAGLKQTMSIWNTSYHYAEDKGGTSALTYDTGIFFSSPAYADKKQGQSVRWVKENNINTGSVVGNDGKIYTTVKIGNQVWTSQNVMETKFRNGDVIPNVEDGFVWSTLMEPALSAYDNNDSIAGTPLYTGGGLDCTVDTVWNHEVIELIAGDGIEILREDDRIIIRAFTNDTTVIPSGGEPGQIFIITDEGDPAWVDICEAIAPCIEEITNRIDTLTEIIIETRNKEYPICLAVHPYFNTVDSTTFTIGEVVADNNVVTSYLIDWYKDGIKVFTTGDSIVHPFTLDVEAGTYTPQIRWINIDGYYYSPTKESGYFYAPDLVGCLPSVNTLVDYAMCSTANPYFSSIDTATIGFLGVGDLVSATHTVGDYVIDWYLNGSIEFSSGTVAGTVYHPFDIPTAGGLYTPQIRWIELDDTIYSSYISDSTRYASDLIGCLPDIGVDLYNCSNGIAGTYSHTVSYDWQGQSGEYASRSVSFYVSPTTQYVPWSFDGDNIADRIDVYYVNGTETLLHSVVAGSDNTSSRLEGDVYFYDSNSPFKSIVDISGFTYAEGAHIRFEITPSYLNPSELRTIWSLSFVCKDAIDVCNPVSTLANNIDTSSVNAYIDTVNCRLYAEFDLLEPLAATSDFSNYIGFSGGTINYGSGGSDFFRNTAESLYIYANLGVSAQRISTGASTISCALNGTGTVVKSGNTLTFSFTNSTDYSDFKTRVNEMLSLISLTYTSDSTDRLYYQDVMVVNYTTCADGSSFIRWRWHYSSPYTFNDGTNTFEVQMQSITNDYIDASCSSVYEAIDALVSDINGSVSYADGTYNYTGRSTGATTNWVYREIINEILPPYYVESEGVKAHDTYQLSHICSPAEFCVEGVKSSFRLKYRLEVHAGFESDPLNNFSLYHMLDADGCPSTPCEVYRVSGGVVSYPCTQQR